MIGVGLETYMLGVLIMFFKLSSNLPVSLVFVISVSSRAANSNSLFIVELELELEKQIPGTRI